MSSRPRTPIPGAVLIFDGECGFCSDWAERVRTRWRPPATIVPWQRAELASLGLDAREAAAAVWFVRGEVRASGHAAIAQLLRAQPGFAARLLGTVLLTPPFSLLARVAYRLLARFRHRLPGGTPACALPRSGGTP